MAGLGPIRVGPVFKPRVHNVDVGALVPAGLPTFGHNYLPHLQEIWDDISPLLGSAVEHLPDPAELLVGHRSLFSAPLPIGDGMCPYFSLSCPAVCDVYGPFVSTVGGEIAMLKCSWCAQHAKHRRITSPALGRSTYQCASCNQKTIICRCCQAAMARARFVDDDYCSDCQSRPIRVPRPSRRYCSWCLEITLHACTEASISGPDEFVCCSSACGKPTTRCNHCLRAMAKITMLKKLDMCHWCYEANARDCLAGRLRKSLFA